MTVRPLADGAYDTAVGQGAQVVPADPTAGSALSEAETDTAPSTPKKTMSLREIKERDALVAGSVKQLRMTAQQIADFSRLWQHPFYDERDVWRRVKALGLERKIKRAAAQSLHDEWTLRIFIKIARDACRNGLPLKEIAKEFRIGENSGIRADMKFRIGDSNPFYLETQHSALTYQGWKSKLTKYVKYRKRTRPFRVLIVMEDEHDLNTVLRYAKEVMEPHPNLTIFYLAYMPDLLGQYDTVREDVWTTHRRQPVALVE